VPLAVSGSELCVRYGATYDGAINAPAAMAGGCPVFNMWARISRSASLAVLGTAVLLVAAGCTSPDGGLPLSWHIEAVDTAGVGFCTSIALDGNDYPRINYWDNTNSDLKYARWTGSAWDGSDDTSGPDIVDTAGRVGEHSSMALDGSGFPHISYWDFTNGDLHLAN
jgi:hypothetical protein